MQYNLFALTIQKSINKNMATDSCHFTKKLECYVGGKSKVEAQKESLEEITKDMNIYCVSQAASYTVVAHRLRRCFADTLFSH